MAASFPRTRAALAVRRGPPAHSAYQLSVLRRGEPVLSWASGETRPGVPMSPESLVPWFSATKVVTALAVVQLWDRGRLALDVPVASVIPEFAAGGKQDLTVRHLLTHTGGFRYVAGTSDPYVGGLDDARLLAAAVAAPQEEGWEPGERAGYHPVTAFHVLGEVVRRVDGRPYERYVSEEVFEPLGMADSWVALSLERAAAYGDRLAPMFDTSGDAPRLLKRFERADGWSSVQPSGSGVGPIGELVRVVEALRRGGELDGERVLSAQAAEAMVARQRAGLSDATFGFVIDWGLGVMVNSRHYRDQVTPYGYGELASHRAFGHGGRQSSIVFADPVHELSVALAFNGMPGEAANHRRTQGVLTALYEDFGFVRAAR